MLIHITKDCKTVVHLLLFLTARLAAQRAKFLKDKIEETQCYKRALDAQVRGQTNIIVFKIMQCVNNILKYV